MSINAVEATSDISIAEMCSGIGQYQTDKNINKPKEKQVPFEIPLPSISMAKIQAMADSPQKIEKAMAQWFIPSQLLTRTKIPQMESGRYYALWADIDKEPPTLEALANLVDEEFLFYDYEVYTSRSAKEDYQKARIIIPLEVTVNGADFELLQECLNDWLETKNIIPDRSSQSASQICYLPNKGEYYNNISSRGHVYIDAKDHFSKQLKQKHEDIKKNELEAKERISQSILKRAARKATGFESVIDEFNDLYQIESILLDNGYKQKGNRFLHPNSESGAYSATVKDGRVNTFSSSDPLSTGGEGAHDAFSVFRVLKHGGNEKAALKDAGDNYLNIGDVSWNKAKQIEYMENKAANGADDFEDISKLTPKDAKPKSFKDFALNTLVQTMKQQMLDDVYILGEFALLGQITNLYAGPNTGKTLTTIKLLIDAVKEGNIKGEDVFYINADDTYRGLVTKTELVNEYNINMLAPGHNGFERLHVEEILKSMTNTDTAKGKIIIIDTLKKFSDLMDKKASSNFMELLRQFVSKGGSAILLAHINKKRDDEGKPIFQGTTDSVDDADCCYTIDCIESNTENDYMGVETTRKSIMFENFKARGDVTQKHTYSYEIIKGQPYSSIIDSFKSLDENDALRLKETQRVAGLLEDNADHIECVLDGIKAGENQKTQLLERLVKHQAISKAAARKVLDIHEGEDHHKGHKWKCKKGGDKNVKVYSPISIF